MAGFGAVSGLFSARVQSPSGFVHTGDAGGTFSKNGVIIFDYQSPTDFKFAGAYFGSGKWLIGHRNGAGWKKDVSVDADIEIETDDQRNRPEKSEVERLWADNSKVKKFTGWEPQYGGVEGFKKGLQKTVNWFSDSDNIKLYKSDIYNV